MRRRVQLNLGDVLELKRSSGLLYIQFVGTAPGLCDAVVYSPKAKTVRPDVTPKLFEGGYVVFYPASLAVSRGMADVVGNLPAVALSDSYRVPRDFEPSGRINSWAIHGPTGVVVKEKLTDGEVGYPIGAVLNDAALVERIVSDWQPAKEVDRFWADNSDDAQTSSEVASDSDSRVVEHYLYFPQASDAKACIAHLQRLGYSTSIRRSADQASWLVLASNSVVPFDAAREVLEETAEQHAGEYDGWEAPVRGAETD